MEENGEIAYAGGVAENGEDGFESYVSDAQIKLTKFLTTEWVNDLYTEDLEEEEKKHLQRYIKRIHMVFYPYVGRLLRLSRINSEEAFRLRMRLDQEIRLFITNMDAGDFTYEIYLALNMVKTIVDTALYAAENGFYRTQLDTQIRTSQVYASSDPMQQAQPGLFARMFGFGGRVRQR